jgi:hypothetical protein
MITVTYISSTTWRPWSGTLVNVYKVVTIDQLTSTDICVLYESSMVGS